MGLGWRLAAGSDGAGRVGNTPMKEALAKGRKWVAPKSRPRFASEVGLSRDYAHQEALGEYLTGRKWVLRKVGLGVPTRSG